MARRSGKVRSRGRAAGARKVPVDRKVLAVSLLFAIASGRGGFLYTLPQLRGLQDARSQLSAASAQVEELTARLAAAAGSGDAELERLYQAVQVLEEAVPPAPSREVFAVRVVQLAEPVGVQVQRMDPTDGSLEGRYVFNARFAGTYPALLTFLSRLEDMGQLVTLSSAQLSSQGDLYVMSATLSLWFSPSDRLTAPLPAAPAAPAPDPADRFETPEPDLGGGADGDEDADEAEDAGEDGRDAAEDGGDAAEGGGQG